MLFFVIFIFGGVWGLQSNIGSFFMVFENRHLSLFDIYRRLSLSEFSSLSFEVSLDDKQEYMFDHCLDGGGDMKTVLVVKGVVDTHDLSSSKDALVFNYTQEMGMEDLCSIHYKNDRTTNNDQTILVLTSKVTLYVPSVDSNGHSLPHAAFFVQNTVEYLSEAFGGCTMMDAVGFWLSSNRLQRESVVVIYSFASNLSKDQKSSVLEYSRWLKREMKQEAIAVEIDGSLFIL